VFSPPNPKGEILDALVPFSITSGFTVKGKNIGEAVTALR